LKDTNKIDKAQKQSSKATTQNRTVSTLKKVEASKHHTTPTLNTKETTKHATTSKVKSKQPQPSTSKAPRAPYS